MVLPFQVLQRQLINSHDYRISIANLIDHLMPLSVPQRDRIFLGIRRGQLARRCALHFLRLVPPQHILKIVLRDGQSRVISWRGLEPNRTTACMIHH